MRKKNGFVLVETAIVVSVLSITLLMLYSSYSHILRVTRSRNTYVHTDSIYSTYLVKKQLEKYNGSVSNFVASNSSICSLYSESGISEYVCDIANATSEQIKIPLAPLEVDKIYYLSPAEILNLGESSKENMLMHLDATTIDYVKSLGNTSGKSDTGSTYKIMIVKYKKQYSDGSYEILHSSMEV